MAITWRTATDWTNLQITTMQASIRQTIDTSVGSVWLALAQSVTGVALWLQRQIIQVLEVTRAATSQGTDLDSFLADFTFARLKAVPSTGLVTFSRATPLQQAIIPIGNNVSTGPGGIVFSITADSSIPSYSTTAARLSNGTTIAGYILAPNVAQVTVPVVSSTAGSVGNVLSGTIRSFVQAVPGVDAVTNTQPLTNGLDAQTDDSARIAFATYINTRSRSTRDAIAFAINQVQQGLTYALHTNQDEAGLFTPGHFVIYVDDGTGNPPNAVLTAVISSVDSYRALAETFSVHRPAVLIANVAMVLTLSPGYALLQIGPLVANAISGYIKSLQIEQQLSYNRLSAVAFNAHPAVSDITGLTLNGGIADIGGARGIVVRSGAITVD